MSDEVTKNIKNKVAETVDKATTKAQDVAETVLDEAEDAVKTTRSAARKTVDKARQAANELRDDDDLDAQMDAFVARAQDLACRSIGYCADRTARAQRHLERASNATAQYIQDQPGKSMLMAAAAGAAVATLIMLLTNRSSRH